MSDPGRRSYIGVCRGDVCLNDLIAAVILALAEEVSARQVAVSYKGVKKACQMRVSHKSVK